MESPGATEAGYWLVSVATPEQPWKGLHSGKKGSFFLALDWLPPESPARARGSIGLNTNRLQLEVSFLKDRSPLAQVFHIVLFLTLAHVLASLFYSSVLLLLQQWRKERAALPCAMLHSCAHA